MSAKLYFFLLLLLASLTTRAQSDFVTVWDLSKSGSEGTQLYFNVGTSGEATYSWTEISPGNASGTGSFNGSGVLISDLPAGATIELRLQPENLQFFRVAYEDRLRLIEVRQWGSIAWTTMYAAFYMASNLNVTATDVPDLSQATDLSFMFAACRALVGPPNIANWDVSNVTNTNYLFNGAMLFNQPLANWNVSNVTSMISMFEGAQLFNQPIGGWNVAKVTTMSGMFAGAMHFNQNVNSWNVENVTSFSHMFHDAHAFNQPLGDWKTLNAVSMSNMFLGAIRFNQNISSWDVSSVVRANGMFQYTFDFNQPLQNWDVSNMQEMTFMFQQAYAFNQPLDSWAAKMHQNVDLTAMLNFSALSIANYDALLRAFDESGLSAKQFSASGLRYCSASTARANLVKSVAEGGKGWTIDGDALDCPLPVTLISFSADKTESGQNLLEWVTADEVDFDRFEIQRAPDAKSFETIGVVKGGADKSQGVLGNYRFSDRNPGEMAYYRLKMVDTDASFVLSKIISIQSEKKSDVIGQFYPNPAIGETTIEIYATEKAEWEIFTTDVSGKVLRSQKTSLSPGMNKIEMKMPRTGLHLVRFENGQNVEVRKVLSAGN